MKALPLLAPLLLAAGIAPAQTPAPAPPPGLADRLAFNARERTALGLAELEAQKPAEAVGAFDAALRLAPEDPLVRYNAGSGHLAAGAPDAAALLEQATEAAPPELAPAAWYNLGNARLAERNAQGAVDAYRETLLRQPDHAAAKHNLELALRELEKQRQEQRKQQEQQKQEEREQQQQQQQQQQGQGEKRPEKQEQQQEQQQQQQQQQGQEGEKGEQRQRPLPRFQDQKDMTAEQAAAILQAVENLERQQRREQALEQARAKADVEKDW